MPIKAGWSQSEVPFPFDDHVETHTFTFMKTITVNVSDPIYRDFSHYAKQVGNSASELIRRAMEDYHQRFIVKKTTLRNRRPASVGGVVQPIGRGDDLLGEMLDDSRN